MPRIFPLIVLILVWKSGLAQIPYALHNPSERIVLPAILREVSGITVLDPTTVAFVQDEKGVIYLYHLPEHKISREISFAGDGDFEGLARVGQDMYVLRSDGFLFEVRDFEHTPNTSSYQTKAACTNSEGLCYDATGNRLLQACKSPMGKGKEFRDGRGIFAFDLATKQSSGLVFEVSVAEVKQRCAQKEIVLPMVVKKNGAEKEQLRIRMSALAIQPGTGFIYVLSAADHLLLVLKPDGSLHDVALLDATLYNKAEGIIFMPNGDLLITNEGQQGQATLLRFKMED